MADSLRPAAPASAVGGFAGRAPGQWPEQQPRQREREPRPADAADEVSLSLGHGAAAARRLLRERVLVRTREQLELGGAETPVGPAFAEQVETETVAAFVGRLMSAQNQLAAARAGVWEPARLRASLDAALRRGLEEALEWTAAAERGVEAATAELLAVAAEYGRRLAAAGADADAHTPER